MATAARRARSSANSRSPWVYRRSDSAITHVITPSVRPRAMRGTVTALRSASSRAMRRCSSSRAAATSISSLISRISSLRPVRITCQGPLLELGSLGYRWASSCAYATFAGSTWATARRRSRLSLTRSMAHQSAKVGTASSGDPRQRRLVVEAAGELAPTPRRGRTAWPAARTPPARPGCAAGPARRCRPGCRGSPARPARSCAARERRVRSHPIVLDRGAQWQDEDRALPAIHPRDVRVRLEDLARARSA